MYVCGPTVYDDAHLGHGKTYVNFDTVVRYLRYLGYDVLYVQNITDVGHLLDSGEDRMLKGAQREHVHPMQLAEQYTYRYFRDMDRLNVGRPSISPRASGHIPEMIAWIRRLVDSGHAYEANGSVYFDVRSYADYGKLSGRSTDEAVSGTRVQILGEKRAPSDFALWKRAEPEHIMRWPSPWGEGFPGWHIECTVMSTKYLGQPFDIHGGGMDNKFPHHECEIAQAESVTGLPFARYWLHNGMLMISGEEMHKSAGNFVTLTQALDEWEPLVIRMFILQGHYRNPLDLTQEALQAAEKGWTRLLDVLRAVRRRLPTASEGAHSAALATRLHAARVAFEESMDDDFNSAGALAAMFDLTRDLNTALNTAEPLNQADLAAVDALYSRLLGDVLGIIPEELDSEVHVGLADGLIALLVNTRAMLRQGRQFAAADAIRDGLQALGVQLNDGADGTTWTVR
jgi:cysteinyl-tRNA synthetase